MKGTELFVVAILLVVNCTNALTRTQMVNSQIWNDFCSPIAALNAIRTRMAFSPMCYNFHQLDALSCCTAVGQTIQANPDRQLCLSTTGYFFSNGPMCPSEISSRIDPGTQSTTRSTDFQFPADPSAIKPNQNTHAANQIYRPAEIAFSKNPADNVQISVADTPQNRPHNRPSAQQHRVPTKESGSSNSMAVPLLNTVGHQATQFALKLFKNLDRPAGGDSLISPLLPQQLLANLKDATSPLAGNEIQSAVLLYPEQIDTLTRSLQKASKSSVNTVETASASFIGKDTLVNQSYVQNARLRGADVIAVDFSQPNLAARTANRWVSEKTHGLINEIVNPGSISSYTRLVLANSIYFKGKWKYSFIKTEQADFENAPGSSRPITSMYQLNKLRYGELDFPDGNGLRWVELPYEGDSLAMLVFLPTRRHQLERSLQQLQAEDVAKVLAQTQSYIDTKVNLWMPKFTLRDTVALIPTFQRLGVYSIFQDSDALKYLSNEPTVVSDITQRSYLSVDEQGTKATSVASLSIVSLSAVPQFRDVTFTVDQPFLVMIVDKQERYPIFIGQIYEPRE